MADITKLATYMNAYGVGVRAGVVTPQTEDEKYIRDLFGLPEMSESVLSLWAETDGVRRPITLVKEEEVKPDAPPTTEQPTQ